MAGINRIHARNSHQLEFELFITFQAKLKHPNLFSTLREEVPAWHRREAAACEQEGNWPGLQFHLGQMLQCEPDNPTAREWQKRLPSKLTIQARVSN
jgi:hypothetical protein